MTIFAGNLSQTVTESDLREAFDTYGKVTFVNIVRDRTNRISTGFGFLEMPVQLEAEAAISGLHGKEIKGKPIVVNEARPKPR
jgi:RNA recognition motif-containing protein